MQRILTYCILLLLGCCRVIAQDCNASFYSEPSSECINCYNFTNTSHSNINSEVSFLWDMGDGTEYYSEHIFHQFRTAETFNVKLNVNVPICTGILEISADGGAPPYEFKWSNNFIETSDSLSIQDSLCPGNYHITITDALNDSIVQNIVLSDMTGIDLNINLEYTNCLSQYPNSCIGSITAIPYGGTPPYEYLWNTGSTENTISDLCPGIYTITICDALNNCEERTIKLPVFECNVSSVIAPSHIDSCNGHITVEANGGISPYSFNWEQNINHTLDYYHSYTDTTLCSGYYSIIIIDSDGETCHTDIEIGPLYLELNTLSPSTTNQCDGKISANVNFGTPPYTYSWSNGSSDSTISGLCSDWYYLTVCDALSNCITDSIELKPLILQNDINWRGPSSPGACDGYVFANTTGGNPAYSYSWDPIPENTPLTGYDFTLANNLCGGTYIITTCDNDDNCIYDTITLTDKPFNVDIAYTNPENDICNGKLHVSVDGTSAPYNFLWSNGEEFLYQTECYLNSLCAGTYYVTICDFENNCAVDSVTLHGLPLGPEIINKNINLASSELDCNASAVIEASGQAPLQFNWSCESWSDENISGINNQCPGTYYVTVCDNNGLCINDSVNLIDLNGTFTEIQSPYNSQCNGSLEYLPYGGYPPYNIIWSNGESTTHASELCPGWHYLSITDNIGNIHYDSTNIQNLIISPLESGYNGLQAATISSYCTDISTQQISTDYFPSLRGQVYFGTNLLPTGVMIFFTEENQKYTAQHVCKIENGNYRIEQLLHPDYYALAIPIFSNDFEYFPIYYPTYYGDNQYWGNAQKIYLYDTIPKDIHLEKSELIKHGKYKIKGKLIYNDDIGFEENIFLPNWYLFDTPGIPQSGYARHIPVYLETENNELLKYQLTDHQGGFCFDHLEEGNYKLHFEKPGYSTQYHIHNTNDSLTDIVYVMDNNTIDLLSTNMSDYHFEKQYKIYPNPASDKITIRNNSYNKTNNNNIRITLYASDGIRVKEIEYMNIFEKVVFLDDIPKGLILLMIDDNETKIVKKLMHH